MIKAYDLEWAVNNDDVIIARLIKYSGGEGNGNISDLFNWVKTAKQQIPDFTGEIQELWIREGNRKRPLVGVAIADYMRRHWNNH